MTDRKTCQHYDIEYEYSYCGVCGDPIVYCPQCFTAMPRICGDCGQEQRQHPADEKREQYEDGQDDLGGAIMRPRGD